MRKPLASTQFFMPEAQRRLAGSGTQRCLYKYLICVFHSIHVVYSIHVVCLIRVFHPIRVVCSIHVACSIRVFLRLCRPMCGRGYALPSMALFFFGATPPSLQNQIESAPSCRGVAPSKIPELAEGRSLFRTSGGAAARTGASGRRSRENRRSRFRTSSADENSGSNCSH